MQLFFKVARVGVWLQGRVKGGIKRCMFIAGKFSALWKKLKINSEHYNNKVNANGSN